MRTRALSLSATSNCCPDDACVIGDALFPLDSLLSVDTGELSEENGVVGGNTACRLSSGRCAARSTLRAGTRKSITRIWAVGTNSCRKKCFRLAR